MNRFKTYSMRTNLTIVTMIVMMLSAGGAMSATLFTEDFELPDVTATNSTGYTTGKAPPGWVRATDGFGASRAGLIDKSSLYFNAPDPNFQAYAFRYTNSGLTSGNGLFGPISANTIYTVTFNVAIDGYSSGTAYETQLIAFAPGDIRTSCLSTPPNSTLLNSKSGTASSSDMSQSDSFSFAVSSADLYVGQDIGVRLIGATTRALSDNVQVDATAISSHYWDLNDTGAGCGSATPSGTWDGVNTYWNASPDGTGPAAAWSSDNIAVFAAGSDASGTYTVTVSGTQDFGGMLFEEGTVTITGGTALRMIRNSAIEVASGVTATIETPISQDSAGRTFGKTGDGTLILAAVCTYTTGNTLVRAGTLQFGASDIINNNSPVVVHGNAAGVTATIDLNGYNDTLNSLILGGASATSGAAITTGSGTLTLGGNLTYLSANNPLGATISGNLSLGTATRTFTINDSSTAADDLTVSAAISGSGGLTKAGAGTMRLSSAINTYTGNTTVSGGTLALSGEASIADGNTLNITSGLVEVETREAIGVLQTNGVAVASGTWGSSSSSATNQDDARFSGPGVLYVGVSFPPAGTLFIIK